MLRFTCCLLCVAGSIETESHPTRDLQVELQRREVVIEFSAPLIQRGVGVFHFLCIARIRGGETHPCSFEVLNDLVGFDTDMNDGETTRPRLLAGAFAISM